VSSFDARLPGNAHLYFRIHPENVTHDRAGSRYERLMRATNRHDAVLELQASRGAYGPWFPLLTVVLQRPAVIDGEALRFRPFRDGRGLTPRGFVHSLRVGVYALSQRARPRQSPT
jgi:hypothetical protein